MTDKNELYTRIEAMEPLLPTAGEGTLAQLTCDVIRKAGALSAQIPSLSVRRRAAQLVREMNSYYSNLIEGHKTLPRDIERALKHDFSADEVQRINQLLNKAHVEVDQLVVERVRAEPELSLHSREFICWIHAEFYRRLPEGLH